MNKEMRHLKKLFEQKRVLLEKLEALTVNFVPLATIGNNIPVRPQKSPRKTEKTVFTLMPVSFSHLIKFENHGK